MAHNFQPADRYGGFVLSSLSPSVCSSFAESIRRPTTAVASFCRFGHFITTPLPQHNLPFRQRWLRFATFARQVFQPVLIAVASFWWCGISSLLFDLAVASFCRLPAPAFPTELSGRSGQPEHFAPNPSSPSHPSILIPNHLESITKSQYFTVNHRTLSMGKL
jgi:hypothetical protein